MPQLHNIYACDQCGTRSRTARSLQPRLCKFSAREDRLHVGPGTQPVTRSFLRRAWTYFCGEVVSLLGYWAMRGWHFPPKDAAPTKPKPKPKSKPKPKPKQKRARS